MCLFYRQPPSGGCVLKHVQYHPFQGRDTPAAFRRLCVETIKCRWLFPCQLQPPSGGCVLKLLHLYIVAVMDYPAAFRRLCVETESEASAEVEVVPSRLQAAVC